MKPEVLRAIGDYLKSEPSISFAFLFGSQARGTATGESDADIGIYFMSAGTGLEWESETVYPCEDKIWTELEILSRRRVDLVVLNRASVGVASEAVSHGVPLLVRDGNLLWRFYLTVSSAAEDMREFVADFMRIRERSRSLTETDKERLSRIVAFLENECAYFDTFQKADSFQYQRDITLKRNIERWAETIVSASIDIAKILLASEKKNIPETYRAVLSDASSLSGFDEKQAQQLARFAKMRNLLAHEYLDLRFKELKQFAAEGGNVYRYLITYAKQKISEEKSN